MPKGKGQKAMGKTATRQALNPINLINYITLLTYQLVNWSTRYLINLLTLPIAIAKPVGVAYI
jgi:hypothetical protein